MKRYFEFKDFLSTRFWEIELDDCTLIIRSGTVGSLGEEERKSFSSFEKAVDAMESQVKRKLAQRYKEIDAVEPEPRKEVRYFEKLSGKDAGFIELSLDDKTVVRRPGDIGSVGERQPFTLDTLAETQRNYESFERKSSVFAVSPFKKYQTNNGCDLRRDKSGQRAQGCTNANKLRTVFVWTHAKLL